MPYVPMSAEQFQAQIRMKRVHQRVANFIREAEHASRYTFNQVYSTLTKQGTKKLGSLIPAICHEADALDIILTQYEEFPFWTLQMYLDLKVHDPFDGTYEFE